MSSVVRVGVGVFVWKDGKFLMGKCYGSHGHGSWSIPGGHLEMNETWEECAAREVMEETGMTITNARFLTVTNDIFTAESKHYVTIWMQSDWQSGQPTITEPDKFISMEWRSFDNLPEPLFMSWGQLRLALPHLFNS